MSVVINTIPPSARLTLQVAAGVQIAVGLFLLTVGFRFFKITAGLIGFLFGFFIMFFSLTYLIRTNPNVTWIAIGSGCGLGLLTGILMFLLPVLALAIVSVFVGIVLGTLLYMAVFVYIRWVYTYYVVVLVCSILSLILGLAIKRGYIIIMTSLYGSFAIAYSLATFIGGMPLFYDPGVLSTPRPANYWLVYVYVVGILASTIMGSIFQFKVTARDLVWSDVAKRPCPRRQSGSRDQPLLERAERASRRAPSRGVCGNCCRRKKRYSESQGYLMEER